MCDAKFVLASAVVCSALERHYSQESEIQVRHRQDPPELGWLMI